MPRVSYGLGGDIDVDIMLPEVIDEDDIIFFEGAFVGALIGPAPVGDFVLVVGAVV